MTESICSLKSNPMDYEAPICGSEIPEIQPAASLPVTFSAAAAERLERWANPNSILTRDLERNSALLARQAFPTPERESLVWDRSPMQYSLLSLLPVACSSHEPLLGTESGSGGDGGHGPTDGGTSTPVDRPPTFTGQDLHAQSPCGPSGIITDLDPGLGVCANYGPGGEHHLFRWNPHAPGSAESIVTLPYAPDQLLETATGRVYISTHENPGLAWVEPDQAIEGHIPFPSTLNLSGMTSSGRSVTSVTPTFSKGLVELDSQIFVATSNLDLAHQDFLPGTVLAYQAATETFETLQTTGYNPTGVATVDGLLLVVSSGALDKDGHATTPATLDVFDPNSHVKLQSLNLGTNGAGLSGELSISDDGSTLVLPTADNSGRLVVVDLDNLQVREIDLHNDVLPSSRGIFLSSLQVSPDGHYAYVSNFNDGRQYVVDLAQGIVVGSPIPLDPNLEDNQGLGDGILSGGKVFIGRGSQILGLNFQH